MAPLSASGRTRAVFVTTHPIQYQAPWFRGLAARSELELHVLFGMMPDGRQQGVGFGVEFAWDVPLLDGYPWSVLENRARKPSLGERRGIDTPGVGRRLAELDPDVVVICGWQSRCLLQTLRAAIGLRLPRIVRGESNDLRHRPVWKRLLQRHLLRRFDAALSIGLANEALLRRVGFSSEQIIRAPYGVDTNHLRGAIADRDTVGGEFRVRTGVPNEAVVALFAGKLAAKKRPGDLVEAIAEARVSSPSLHLLVVGSGPLEEELRRRTHALGVPVTFTGFLNQSEIGAAYAAADLFVLPSDAGETWGLVVNEAQAVGVPVIVSDLVGCGPDLVESGVTGYTYPCGDVAALAARIVNLADDPTLRHRLGEAGRRRVADYSVEAAVEGTVRAIEWVIDAQGRSSP